MEPGPFQALTFGTVPGRSPGQGLKRARDRCPATLCQAVRLSSHPSDLQNLVEIEFDAGGIFADADDLVADEAMGRYRQIGGRRRILEHAAGQIVFRAVAGTEVAAEP